MKKLLISINSFSEKTGGALYLKTLFAELKGKEDEVKLICKSGGEKSNSNFIVKEFEKNFIADLVSRLFLCPSFLMFYFFKLLSISKQSDEVHFHSSRLISIAYLIKVINNKRVIVHSDNIEYSLSAKLISNFREAPLRIFDSILLFFYEKVLIHLIDKVTFITELDKKRINHSEADVIPIKVFSNNNINVKKLFLERKTKETSVIFVGSFSYQPNIEAFENICSIASDLSDIKFRIVGRNAKFLTTNLNNVLIYSDVSNDELEKLYLESHLCLTVINKGGGMKTKVAEAMSYNLPVVATEHSLIGYEKVIESKLIFKVNDKLSNNEIAKAITKAYYLYKYDQNMFLFKVYWNDFLNNYKL